MPHAGHDEAGVARMEGALLPVAGEVKDAVQHLKRFFLQLMLMRRMFLAGELCHNFFAVLAVDAVDDDRAIVAKFWDAIMM